ncbi:MAG: uracil-DNA glycosylase [Candidatus Komeilibacteria bacterium]|nr:uracil-DNA glycosylase [Candidatus Komeilibacteria bacterium]
MTKDEQLLQIKEEILNLTQSPLYKYRAENNYWPVIGEGNHDAVMVFIGEAPGENEAKTGRPFCGAAGRVLDELLAGIELKRGDVYVTNVVKDRPPLNRDPFPEEIDLYGKFLLRQLEIIRPKVIVTLGRHSMNFIFDHLLVDGHGQGISKCHGQIFTAALESGPVKIIPMYHPAAALYQGSLKKVMMEDFMALSDLAS